MRQDQLQKLAQQPDFKSFENAYNGMHVKESMQQVMSFLEKNAKEYKYKGAASTATIINEEGSYAVNNVSNVTNVTNNYYITISITVNITYSNEAIACLEACETAEQVYQYMEAQGQENYANAVISDLGLVGGHLLKEGAVISTKVAGKTLGLMTQVFLGVITFFLYFIIQAMFFGANVVSRTVGKQLSTGAVEMSTADFDLLPKSISTSDYANNNIINLKVA